MALNVENRLTKYNLLFLTNLFVILFLILFTQLAYAMRIKITDSKRNGSV